MQDDMPNQPDETMDKSQEHQDDHDHRDSGQHDDHQRQPDEDQGNEAFEDKQSDLDVPGGKGLIKE